MERLQLKYLRELIEKNKKKCSNRTCFALDRLMNLKRSLLRETVLGLYVQGNTHSYVAYCLGITYHQWEHYRLHVMSSELRDQIKHARRLHRVYKEEENMRKVARGL